MITALVLLALGGLWMMLRPRADLRGADARNLVAAGARLVDVRTPAEYAAGHLPGAVNVPLDQLEQRLADFGPPQRDIVLYCRSGARSGHAKRTLQRHGFTAVHNLGAMSAW